MLTQFLSRHGRSDAEWNVCLKLGRKYFSNFLEHELILWLC